MTERTTTRLAWSLCILAIAGGSAFVLLEATRATRSISETFLGNGQEAFGAIAFATVGALIVSRGKRNAIGWLFLAIGLSYGFSAVGSALSDTTAEGSTMWQWGIWLNTWSWVPGWFLMVTLLFLLFPDGHLPSERWRWVAWLGVAAVVLAIVGGELSPTAGGSTPGYVSPLPTAPDTVANLGLILSMLCLVVAAVASVVALIGRYRRSTGEERLQMKWFVYAAVVSLVLTPTRSVAVHQPILLLLGLLSTLILPVAVGIAILKYRLYDIDVVIRKTVVFAIAVVILTTAFVAGAALVGSGRVGERHRGTGGCRVRGRTAVRAGATTGVPDRRPGGVRWARDPVRGAERVLRAGLPRRTTLTTCSPGSRRSLHQGSEPKERACGSASATPSSHRRPSERLSTCLR